MKNIVICCDGTGNEFGENPTNVAKLYLLADRNKDQKLYYDPGVGTGGWKYSHLLIGRLKAVNDQATGKGLQKNVEEAYRYLMVNYEDGDKIYLFGFSRGAFTVRSLAGMLHRCGLLYPDNDNLITYASKIYNEPNDNDLEKEFKRGFTRPCPVHFIGVWDTVSSMTHNAGKKFYDGELNSEVQFGYQALAIDEKRKNFPPDLWDFKYEGQHIEQVWFAGVHSDIGGWYDETGLSNITLQWMAKKAIECGLKVDQKKLSEYKSNPTGKIHESYTGFWKILGKNVRDVNDPLGTPKVHSSVVERMNDKKLNYHPELPEHFEEVD